jgi:hypothetical protein
MGEEDGHIWLTASIQVAMELILKKMYKESSLYHPPNNLFTLHLLPTFPERREMEKNLGGGPAGG